MFETFISNLKITDNRLISIEILDGKIKEFKIEYKNAKNYHQEFDIKEKINNYTKCIAHLHFILHEVDEGIDYFQKNYIEVTKEVKEYILLEELEKFKLDDYWLKEYESKKSTIDFRDSLKERYQKLKINH